MYRGASKKKEKMVDYKTSDYKSRYCVYDKDGNKQQSIDNIQSVGPSAAVIELDRALPHSPYQEFSDKKICLDDTFARTHLVDSNRV